ncbi:MAG: ABC transporter permease [Chitinophagaceae bacterium]|nr:ABC transporter permease [Chitinophagaceae bacterium]
MPRSYSQFKAMWAIAKASLRALMKSPSSIVFSIAFPLIFILIFGFMGGSGPVINIAFDKNSDTGSANPIIAGLKQVPNIRISRLPEKQVEENLSKGRITAVLHISANKDSSQPKYKVNIKSSTAGADRINILRSIVQTAVYNAEYYSEGKKTSFATITEEHTQGRIYRTIDFILPGQLGFSLLSTGVFGIAFMLFNLRETLVLKRYYASPIRKGFILLGEGLARVIFQLFVSAFILLLGKYFFKFTLVNGWITFAELLVLSMAGILVFMGFGFFISGVSKNMNAVPVLTNLIGFPQFLLSGTFFPTDNFPSWLKPVADVLPLKHLNDAMRNVAFEGSHLTDCGKQLGILAIWAIVMYALSVKVYKWD